MTNQPTAICTCTMDLSPDDMDVVEGVTLDLACKCPHLIIAGDVEVAQNYISGDIGRTHYAKKSYRIC